MYDYKLARKVDSSVPETRWIASLSNGETIYENNFKTHVPAWERLGRYIEDNNLSITNLRLQIAGHTEEVKIPSGRQGYIQKKIAWTVGGITGGQRHCIGYSQDGLALIYEVDIQRGSRTKRTIDPGSPWTIYSLEKRNAK